LHEDATLRVTVERSTATTGAPKAATATSPTGQIVITLPPSPLKSLGLVMQMGPVTAVQDGSPAAHKGVIAGDLLRRIDGRDVGDPLTLPERIYQLSQRLHSVDLVVVRDGKEVAISGLPLWPSDRLDTSFVAEGSPMVLSPLGIAYQVSNTVEALTAGSPAAASELKPGNVLARVRILPPPGKLPDDVRQAEIDIKLRGDKHNVPAMFDALQRVLPGSRVEISLDDGRKATITPVEVQGLYYPDRGFLYFAPKTYIRKAGNFAEALALGTRETGDSLTSVFRFLKKIGRQVDPRATSGPIEIARAAYRYASRGLGTFLVFLAFISANLAVVNFLPIPVLDGGHMVFLAYEGIRGKPPSEKIQVGLTYAGLLFLVGLMIFVFGLDLSLISRE
jgi:regulator of sigma E protease